MQVLTTVIELANCMGLPDKTLDFIKAINSIIPARNLEDLFLMLRFHPAKLKIIRQAANKVTQRRLQRFDNLLLKVSGSIPKEKVQRLLGGHWMKWEIWKLIGITHL